MVCLGVIGAYLLLTAAIIVFDIISLEDTMARVGPNSMPGLSLSQKPEKRVEDAEQHYLARVERALTRSDQKQALERIAFGPRHVADVSPAESEALMQRGYALVDELYESRNLDADPSALPKVAELEAVVDELYPMPTGVSGLLHDLQLVAGTDRQGRSIALRALYSIKVAVLIGLVAAFISVLIGTVLGAAAAFFGGGVDHAVIWLYSTFSAIPGLVLLTVLVYAFSGGPFDGTLIPVYASLCMTFWIGPCRVIRGEAMKVKELEYVQAAVSVGFGRFYILIKHVIPNTIHLVFINFSLLFIGAIKSEVILSFLGLGVKEGPSWGIMISQSKQEVINGFYWQLGSATALMFVLVLAFNILTDALQDAFDPKHVG
jgi:peptide/nickel transport system permease protein